MAKVTITFEDDTQGGFSVNADFGPGLDTQKDLTPAQSAAMDIMSLVSEAAETVLVDGEMVKSDTKGMH